MPSSPQVGRPLYDLVAREGDQLSYVSSKTPADEDRFRVRLAGEIDMKLTLV
jgi:hypothetical protein